MPEMSQYELDAAARLQARDDKRKEQNREAAAFAKDFGDATFLRPVGKLAMYLVLLAGAATFVLAVYAGVTAG